MRRGTHSVSTSVGAPLSTGHIILQESTLITSGKYKEARHYTQTAAFLHLSQLDYIFAEMLTPQK